MLYHETKDMYYVMMRLGHKKIKNTLLYVQLEEASVPRRNKLHLQSSQDRKGNLQFNRSRL